MLSGLNQLLDKNFVIGFLLPVILALITASWVVPDLAITAPLHNLAANDESLGKLTYLILLSYGLATLLMIANNALYRLLEGYGLPKWLAGRLRRRQEAKRSILLDEYKDLYADWSAQGETFTQRARVEELRLQLVGQFPPAEQAAMPTGFGNVIRAFEAYPLVLYGADGVLIWQRLAAVITPAFASEIDDARAQVNFMLNLLYMLPLMAAIAAWQGIADTRWPAFWFSLGAGHLAHWRLSIQGVVLVVALLLIGPVYAATVAQAMRWGSVVKAAFDCFLPALIKQLGYEAPTTHEASRTFWDDFLQAAAYWHPMTGEQAPLAGYVPAPNPKRKSSLERWLGS